ncbi:S-formylglutathione hydrolase [Tetranychus urticae]|uniref:S-formylglutathione hydrolase n=1 Tax=Tetranychus urticae TaxID=32264 RepID=T1KFE1_TETUR|nr:S-formylglutathione hydrolase [Tetranychus urticae]
MSELKEVWNFKSHEGYQKAYQHHSRFLKNTHEFSIYLPPKAVKGERCPVVYWLTGAASDDREFMLKSGFQKYASENEIIVVAPEPRPLPLNDMAKEISSKYFVQFGFYLDATEPPYDEQFKMYSYVMDELMPLVEFKFPVLQDKRGIAGHSMGGMGALNLGLRHHDLFQSISVFSAVCNPSKCTIGQELMKYYFGEGAEEATKLYDPCVLAANYTGPHRHILFDHGGKDELDFLVLAPNFLKSAMYKNLSVTYRLRSDYTHGIEIISSYIEDHIIHHRKELNWNP